MSLRHGAFVVAKRNRLLEGRRGEFAGPASFGQAGLLTVLYPQVASGELGDAEVFSTLGAEGTGCCRGLRDEPGPAGFTHGRGREALQGVAAEGTTGGKKRAAD